MKLNKKPTHRINEQINSSQVRIVNSEEHNGLTTLSGALQIATENEMDVVELSVSNGISIVRIIDYNKYLYLEKKKLKDMKNNTVQQELKEIKLSLNIDENDIAYRVKHAIEFLSKKNKVKLTLFFKGRQIVFKEQGEMVMLNFINELVEYGLPEALPRLEGKKLSCIVKPK